MITTETRPVFLDVAGTNLHPHPDNLRTDLGEWKELAGSIKANGILTRLVVQPIPDGDRVGHYRILAGHRRHRAGTSIASGFVFPVEVKYGLTEAQVQTYLFVENLDREKLGPSEEALGYFKLIGLGTSMTDLVKATGRSKSHIQTHLNLLECPAEIRRLVDNETLSIRDALEAFRGVDNDVVLEFTTETDDEDISRYRLSDHVKRRAAEAELQVMYDRLVEGGDRVETDVSALPDGSAFVVDSDGIHSVPRGQKTINVDPKAHRHEDCHLSLVVMVNRMVGLHPKRYEICTDPKSHKVKGASATKAKPKTKSEYDKAVTATEKEAKTRQLVALQAAVATKRIEALDNLVLRTAIVNLGNDAANNVLLITGWQKENFPAASPYQLGEAVRERMLKEAVTHTGLIRMAAIATLANLTRYAGVERDEDVLALVVAHGYEAPPQPDRKDFADG